MLVTVFITRNVQYIYQVEEPTVIDICSEWALAGSLLCVRRCQSDWSSYINFVHGSAVDLSVVLMLLLLLVRLVHDLWEMGPVNYEELLFDEERWWGTIDKIKKSRAWEAWWALTCVHGPMSNSTLPLILDLHLDTPSRSCLKERPYSYLSALCDCLVTRDHCPWSNDWRVECYAVWRPACIRLHTTGQWPCEWHPTARATEVPKDEERWPNLPNWRG